MTEKGSGMDSVLDKIAGDRVKYSCAVKTLGECTIVSPVRRHDFIKDGQRVLLTCDIGLLDEWEARLGHKPSFERAGAHEKIFHDPSWTRVGIVTAGGLCPGLNNVIKGLVEILSADYGIKSIFGIRYGYAGLNPKFGYAPIPLDVDSVDTIHEHGGTILGSSRGQQPTDTIVDTLVRMNINVLFCIGGDGSLRCAHEVATAALARNLKISVIGIPKTIDNDLYFVGRSFGFETAVAEAAPVIRSAHIEAKGAHNGIGLVKLMGRDSGFIAAYAAMANPVVNFCLVPETDFMIDGPTGLLAAIERRFASGKDHAVIVVAEGAGQKFFDENSEKDASGNVLKKDIGRHLRDRISQHFSSKGVDFSVKYFDPSYTIRSVPARGTDAIRCYMLARNAVHAAMAGRTDCVVGEAGELYTLVPMALATIERQRLNLSRDLWRCVMDATGQEWLFEPDDNTTTRRKTI